jgi:hypothetical protein
LSCPAQAGHPVITDNAETTGSSAFADDDSKGIEASCLIFLPMKAWMAGTSPAITASSMDIE